MILAALLSHVLSSNLRTHDLQITFPAGEAGLPSVSLSGRLWANASPIVAGRGCTAQLAGTTLKGTGSDIWGAYDFMLTNYTACGLKWEARVQVYENIPAAKFATRFPDAAEGTGLSNGTKSPSLAPIVAFPSVPFSAPMTATSNFAWNSGQLGFASHTSVSAASFNGQTGNVPSPLFFVDDQNATLVVAPLDHFHSWTCKPLTGKQRAWGCGTMSSKRTRGECLFTSPTNWIAARAARCCF